MPLDPLMVRGDRILDNGCIPSLETGLSSIDDCRYPAVRFDEDDI